jgi:hypothetical protein
MQYTKRLALNKNRSIDKVRKHNICTQIDGLRNLKQSYKYQDCAWRTGMTLSEFRTIQEKE